MQTLTDAGLSFIAKIEGFSATPYNDPPGSDKYSIGFGHQIQSGESFPDPITIEQGRALLAKDTQTAQNAVKSAITVPLNSNQFDALTSFVFNIGEGAFKSGSVPAKINAGDFQAAADTMRQYVKAGGVVSQALVDRRESEASVFDV